MKCLCFICLLYAECQLPHSWLDRLNSAYLWKKITSYIILQGSTVRQSNISCLLTSSLFGGKSACLQMRCIILINCLDFEVKRFKCRDLCRFSSMLALHSMRCSDKRDRREFFLNLLCQPTPPLLVLVLAAPAVLSSSTPCWSAFGTSAPWTSTVT